MPGVQFSNAACLTCKQRHLKCDEHQPACHRCVKAGRTCKRAESVFHIENAYASRQRKRPRGPRSNPIREITEHRPVLAESNSTNVSALAFPLRTSPSSQTLSDRSISPPLPSPISIPPSPQLSVDYRNHAVAFYLRFHLQSLGDVPDVLKGQAESVLSLLPSETPGSLLDLAVSSLALAVFAHQNKAPKAAVCASAHYQKLLEDTRSKVINLDSTNLDSCLLATFFMGRYEDAVFAGDKVGGKTPFNKSLASFSHHDGGLAIMKAWILYLSHKQPASDAVRYTRRGMIRSALLRNLPVPNWMQDGATFGEKGLELEYDRIAVRTVTLRYNFSQLQDRYERLWDTSEDLTSKAQMLNEEAQCIDEALKTWMSHFPMSWKYQRHSLPLDIATKLQTSTVYTFKDTGYAALWNLYHSKRILINGTRVQILNLISQDPRAFTADQLLEARTNMQSMANDFGASLPYFLRKIKAHDTPESPFMSRSVSVNSNEISDFAPYMATSIVWPLTLASSMRGVSVEQKAFFRHELRRLGTMAGHRIFEHVDSERWVEF